MVFWFIILGSCFMFSTCFWFCVQLLLYFVNVQLCVITLLLSIILITLSVYKQSHLTLVTFFSFYVLSPCCGFLLATVLDSVKPACPVQYVGPNSIHYESLRLTSRYHMTVQCALVFSQSFLVMLCDLTQYFITFYKLHIQNTHHQVCILEILELML